MQPCNQPDLQQMMSAVISCMGEQACIFCVKVLINLMVIWNLHIVAWQSAACMLSRSYNGACSCSSIACMLLATCTPSLSADTCPVCSIEKKKKVVLTIATH